MMTTTPSMTSFENEHLRRCDYCCDDSTLCEFYSFGGDTARGAVEINQRIKDLLLYAHAVGKSANFALLFCRGRHEIVSKCVPHVQHTYFLPCDQSNS